MKPTGEPPTPEEMQAAREALRESTAEMASAAETFEAMHYDGTLDAYWRIIEWAKSKRDTNALANEWIFRTPIITFPSYDARFKAVEPGDYVVWNGKGFDVGDAFMQRWVEGVGENPALHRSVDL